jgi:uncharacterized protein (DUF302 family)
MNTTPLSALCLLFALAAPIALAAPSGTPPPTVVYKANASYEEVKEFINLAIEGRGLLVRGMSHVSEMLNRTGKDLGYTTEVFSQAENFEFCSADLSHQMVAVDPSNATTCPLVISVYILTSEPGQVYVAFRRQVLAGQGIEPIEQKIFDLVDAIVREAIE